jgi:hypothetical protein
MEMVIALGLQENVQFLSPFQKAAGKMCLGKHSVYIQATKQRPKGLDLLNTKSS